MKREIDSLSDKEKFNILNKLRDSDHFDDHDFDMLICFSNDSLAIVRAEAAELLYFFGSRAESSLVRFC